MKLSNPTVLFIMEFNGLLPVEKSQGRDFCRFQTLSAIFPTRFVAPQLSFIDGLYFLLTRVIVLCKHISKCLAFVEYNFALFTMLLDTIEIVKSNWSML